MQKLSLPWEVELVPGLRAAAVFIYDAAVEPSAYRLDLAAQPWTAWYIRKGCVRVKMSKTAGGSAMAAGSGNWVLLPPGPRRHEMGRGTVLLSIRFHLRDIQGLPALDAPEPLRFGGRDAENLERAARGLPRVFDNWLEGLPDRTGYAGVREGLGREDARFTALAARNQWSNWLAVLLCSVTRRGWVWRERAQPGRLLGAMQQVRCQHGWRGLSPSSLAAAAGVTPTHLRRLCRAELGCAPGSWIDALRLEEADRRLRLGEPVKSIAYELGFSSAPHFSTWFRRQLGRAPTQWRVAGCLGDC